jgi:Putative DnaT-like ssDNA binding protein
MALTVGTDSYITVANAKVLAPQLSEEGKDFATLSDAIAEEALLYSMAEIEELELSGEKRSSGNALEFPRAFFHNTRDPSGTTIASRAQVYNAIAINQGLKRNLDSRIIRSNTEAFDDMSVHQLLASVDAFSLLKKEGYVRTKSPTGNNRLRASNNKRLLRRLL